MFKNNFNPNEEERLKNNKMSNYINGRNLSLFDRFKKYLVDLLKNINLSNNFSKKIENKSKIMSLKPQSFDDKVSAIDQLFYRSQNYNTSKEYMEEMKFIIKLKNLAPFNAWLLYQQDPNVTYVATANYWAEIFNRSINPKARAFVIMRAFGPVDFVYDIRDTLGDEELPINLQAHFRAEGILSNDVLDKVLKCCTKKNIEVSFDDTIPNRLAGWANHNKLNQYSQIVINNSHTSEVQFSTLCHELAHLMLGHCGKFSHCECEDRSNLSSDTKEIEAETISWIICDRLNIKTDAEKYLHQHFESKHSLDGVSMSKILTISDKIESIICGGLCKVDKPKK